MSVDKYNLTVIQMDDLKKELVSMECLDKLIRKCITVSLGQFRYGEAKGGGNFSRYIQTLITKELAKDEIVNPDFVRQALREGAGLNARQKKPANTLTWTFPK